MEIASPQPSADEGSHLAVDIGGNDLLNFFFQYKKNRLMPIVLPPLFDRGNWTLISRSLVEKLQLLNSEFSFFYINNRLVYIAILFNCSGIGLFFLFFVDDGEISLEARRQYQRIHLHRTGMNQNYQSSRHEHVHRLK